MKFTCIIFHLFFQDVQLFSHAAHFSGHNIYAFGSILYCLVQSPNGLAYLVNCPNEATTIDIPFWRTMANFCNMDPQPILWFKTSNDFILPFLKGLHWIFCFFKNGINFVLEGGVVGILVLTRRFIPNNSKKCFMKSHNRSRKNIIKLLLCLISVFWINSDSTSKLTISGSVCKISRVGGTTP